MNTRNPCRYKVKTGYNAGRNAGRIAVLPVTGMALFHPGKEHGDVPEYDTSPCYEVGTLLVLWINLLSYCHFGYAGSGIYDVYAWSEVDLHCRSGFLAGHDTAVC